MAGQQYEFAIVASGEARDAEGRLLDTDGCPIDEDNKPAPVEQEATEEQKWS